MRRKKSILKKRRIFVKRFQICTDGRSSHFVDAKDCKTANWMRYVNCARTRAEQNVTAYQHCGEVYYRAHSEIPVGVTTWGLMSSDVKPVLSWANVCSRT